MGSFDVRPGWTGSAPAAKTRTGDNAAPGSRLVASQVTTLLSSHLLAGS